MGAESVSNLLSLAQRLASADSLTSHADVYNAFLEGLTDALTSLDGGSSDDFTQSLLVLLIAALDKPSVAVEQVARLLHELYALLPSTSASIEPHFDTEIGGVAAEDIVLPPGPVSALQQIILDVYDVCFNILSEPALVESRTAEQNALVRKREADTARQKAEEMVKIAAKTRSPEDQSRVEGFRKEAQRTADGYTAARTEQQRTRLDGDGTPHTARIKSLILLLTSLQDILPAPLIRIRVDPLALSTAGMIDGSQAKLENRAKTQKYFKQQYFNLLREETEGYAKLIVELLSNMGPAHDPATGLPSEPTETCRARAEVVMSNIKSLIGYFDLHPHRALDIVLDVFSEHVVHHHMFFRQLLALSPWAERTQSGNIETAPKQASEERGSRQIASILGFKFAFYQQPEGPSETPHRLYYMAAILIWDGLVAMPDLYPHLTLSDETLKAAQEKSSLASRGKAKTRMNALAMAGALGGPLAPSSVAPTTSNKTGATAAEEHPRDPPNQKLGLASALCSIGDLEHAFFILSRFPYLIGAHPNIADDLVRAADYMIDPVYRSLPLNWKRNTDSGGEAGAKVSTFGHRRPRWSLSEKKIVQPTAPRPQLSVYAFTKATADTPLTFFFPEWRDRLPATNDAEEAMNEVIKLMRYIGPLGSRNLRFFHKLIRIGAATVSAAIANGDDAVEVRWRDILRKNILPGISIAEPNPGLAFALWELLALYTYEERFSLYGEWATVTYHSTATLRDRLAEADRESKDALRRIAADNTRQMSRAMAKIAHGNPCIFFGHALNQIQNYSNMIAPVVESGRYLSDMAYDVLEYILLENLSRDKDRTKADGTNTSEWLLNLATFSGSLCRRYDMKVEPLLRFILAQIHRDNVQDLIVFRELLAGMTEVKAIDPLLLSDDQVRLLAGSPLLRTEVTSTLVEEALTTAQDRKLNDKALKRWQTHMVATAHCQQLIVRIALCRQQCIDRMKEPEASHVRSIASIYDQTHLVLFQLVEYLEVYHADMYDQLVPSLEELVVKFGIDPVIAFHIARPGIRRELSSLPSVSELTTKEKRQSDLDSLRQKLQAARAAAAARKEAAATSETEATINDDSNRHESNGDAALVEPTASTEADENVVIPETHTTLSAGAASETNGHPKADVDAMEAESTAIDQQNERTASLDTADSMAVDLAEKEAEAAQEEDQTKLPDARGPHLEWLQNFMRFDNGQTALFYLTFWELKLYDIFTPTAGYAATVDIVTKAGPGLKGQLSQIDERMAAEVNVRLPTYATEQQKKEQRELGFQLSRETKKIRAAMPRLEERIPLLKEDEKTQVDHVARVLARCQREKARWVMPGKVSNFSRLLISNCVRFRAPLSPGDALYCGHLILLLHRIGTPEFNIPWICDQIFANNLTIITASFTEPEARNYGFFLSVVFGQMRRWAQGDEQTFQKEAIGDGPEKLPGFRQTGLASASESHWPYDKFRRCVLKWEDKTYKALKLCLEGQSEHARNALRILIQLVDNFPIHANIGEELDGLASKLKAKPETKVLANGYAAALIKRRKDWAKPVASASALRARQQASAAPLTPKAATPEPTKAVEAKPVKVSSDVSGPQDKPPVLNGIPDKLSTPQDAATPVRINSPAPTSNVQSLPPRPAVDPNWREREAERRKPAEGRSVLEERRPADQRRPAPLSRQPSDGLKVLPARPSTPPASNLRSRLDQPLRDRELQTARASEGDKRREPERDARAERPRESGRDTGPMEPPAAPASLNRVAPSPRREEPPSPRAPRADRERERDRDEAHRRVSRQGTPDSSHSSSYPLRSQRDVTPGRDSAPRRDDRREDPRRDTNRRGDRTDREHGHRSERHSSSGSGRHSSHTERRDRDKERGRDRDRERTRASANERRGTDDDDEHAPKRRRTESPGRSEATSKEPSVKSVDGQSTERVSAANAPQDSRNGSGTQGASLPNLSIRGRATNPSSREGPVARRMLDSATSEAVNSRPTRDAERKRGRDDGGGPDRYDRPNKRSRSTERRHR